MNSEIGRIYITAAQLIHRRSCKVHIIIVTPDGTNASYADVYNGENTNAPKIARLRVVGTTSKPFNFDGKLELDRGLYIDFGANLQAVTVLSQSP